MPSSPVGLFITSTATDASNNTSELSDFIEVTPPTIESTGLTGLAWLRQFGSSNSTQAFGISAHASGVYVAGRTNGALPGQSQQGGLDAFVRQYDVDGNEIWTHQFGSPGFRVDEVLGISVHDSGVYVAGRTNGALPGQSQDGFSFDAFVRKYDFDGNELWTRQFGTSGFDAASGISVHDSGVYVAGETFGALPGQSSGGNGDAFLRKYDLDGNETWTHQFGSGASEAASAISVHDSGVYVAGQSNSPQSSAFPPFGVFVHKYDLDGNELWARQFGSSGLDEARGISVHASGVYTAGTTNGTLPGQTYQGGFFDAFVHKYDLDGNEIWIRQFGSSGFDQAFAISAHASGVYVAGSTDEALPGQIIKGKTDAFIRTYDFDGNEVRTREFGTGGSNHLYGISVDESGVHAAGDVTQGTFPGQTSAGFTDAFVVKFPLDSDGDGILDIVDLLPTEFSDDFDDAPSGTTFGRFLARGDQLVTLTDSPEPPPDDGVLISGDSAGGSAPVLISVCGGAALYSVSPGENVFISTCGSVRTRVISGYVEITHFADDHRTATVTLNEGNAVVFDPTTFTITADPGNDNALEIATEGGVFLLPPGESLTLPPLDHFLCYDAKSSMVCAADSPKNAGRSCKKEKDCGGKEGRTEFCGKFSEVPVFLDDELEAGDFNVKKPEQLCTPAGKDGSGIFDEMTHLEGYKITEEAILETRPPFDSCTECEDGVSSMTLRYLGAQTADIMVEADDGVFPDFFPSVAPNTELSFAGLGMDGKLGDTTRITTGLSETELDTSCSAPAGPGVIFGDGQFEVVAAASAEGGAGMCPVIQVANQFGRVFVEVKKSKRLLVPTAKDLEMPPPMLPENAVDHFKCYDVKAPKLDETIRVSLTDQFHQDRIFDVDKIERLCNPVDKNGEGIKSPESHLLCYQVKLVSGFCSTEADEEFVGRVCKKEQDCGGTANVTSFCELQPKDQTIPGIFLSNQFGEERVDIDKVKEICVPSSATTR